MTAKNRGRTESWRTWLRLPPFERDVQREPATKEFRPSRFSVPRNPFSIGVGALVPGFAVGNFGAQMDERNCRSARNSGGIRPPPQFRHETMHVEEAARMNHSVRKMSRGVRLRLENVFQRRREKDYTRRALALLHLWKTRGNVSEVPQRLRAAPSSVQRWRLLPKEQDESDLRSFPMQNQKHYIAGALHAHTGRFVVSIDGPGKMCSISTTTSPPRVECPSLWLACDPKFPLLFQHTYCSWVNVLERLWKVMHGIVIRNHRCRSMYGLCQSDDRCLEVVQPPTATTFV